MALLPMFNARSGYMRDKISNTVLTSQCVSGCAHGCAARLRGGVHRLQARTRNHHGEQLARAVVHSMFCEYVCGSGAEGG